VTTTVDLADEFDPLKMRGTDEILVKPAVNARGISITVARAAQVQGFGKDCGKFKVVIRDQVRAGALTYIPWLSTPTMHVLVASATTMDQAAQQVDREKRQLRRHDDVTRWRR
jgi:hypothetical protein